MPLALFRFLNLSLLKMWLPSPDLLSFSYGSLTCAVSRWAIDAVVPLKLSASNLTGLAGLLEQWSALFLRARVLQPTCLVSSFVSSCTFFSVLLK